MAEEPTMTGLIQFIHYAKKEDYLALPEREVSTLYLISDSEEVYLGDKPFGVSIYFGAALPPTLFRNKLYAITNAGTTKFYKFDGTSIVELTVAGGGSGTVTPDSEDTLTNKTIDADDNEISNLRVSNFAQDVILEDITDPGTLNNESLPTTIAVYNLISEMMTIKHFL